MKVKIKTIWGEIRDRLPEEEHYEMKSLIGFDLVEQTEEILAEIESFSTLALFSSGSKNSVVGHIEHFTEFTDSVNSEIGGFVDCFRMKPSCAEKGSSTKSQPNTTSSHQIEVANGFRDHLLSLDKIRHLLSVELQKMKKKLGNLQTMVLSSLIGSTQTTLSTGEERLNIVSELTWMDRGENGGDLKSNMEAERILSSRFDHKCERCIPRSRIDIKFPSTAYSSTHDQMQKELTSLSLNSVSDNESDAEPLISEDLGVKQLGEFSTVSFDGEESTPLSTSQIPLPANSQTSSCMANVLRPLPAPSMTTTTASSFNRIPPLSRLHPLKLRPVAKANSRLSRSKEVRHGANNGRKSPLTALPGGRAPDLKSGRNSASAHSHMPRKSSIPCPPPPPRAGLAKRVPIPAARKIV